MHGQQNLKIHFQVNPGSQYRPAHERGALVNRGIKTSKRTYYSIFLHKKRTSVRMINYIPDVQIKSYFPEIRRQ